MALSPEIMPFNLWHIRAGDEINNFDLFVIAQGIDGACDLWREYFDTDENDYPEYLTRLLKLPNETEARALAWDELKSFRMIGRDEYIKEGE